MGQTAAPGITENVEENEGQAFDTSTREGLEAFARQGVLEVQQTEQALADQGITSMNVQLNDMKRMLIALTDIEGKTVQLDPESGGIRVTDVATGDYTDSVVSVAREVTDENGNVTVEGDTPVIDESNLVTVVENGQPQLENLEGGANLLNPDGASPTELYESMGYNVDDARQFARDNDLSVSFSVQSNPWGGIQAPPADYQPEIVVAEYTDSDGNVVNPENAPNLELTADQEAETTQRVEQEGRDQVARLTQDEQMKQVMEGGPLAIIMAFFQAMASGENPIEAMMNMFNPAEAEASADAAVAAEAEAEADFEVPADAEERATLFEGNDQKMDENNEKISGNLAKIEENAAPEGNAALLAENEQLLADNAELVEQNAAINEYDEALVELQRLELFAENRATIEANAATIQDNQDNGITEGNQALLDENQRLLDENEELLRDGEEPSNDSGAENDGAESNLTGVNNSASTYTYNDGTSGVGEPTINLDEGTVEISGQSGSDAFNSVSNPDDSTISQVDARVDQTVDAGNDLEGQDNVVDAQIITAGAFGR